MRNYINFRTLSVVLVAFALAIAFIGLIAYFSKFPGSMLSGDHTRWSEFGGFVGAVVALSSVFVSSAIAIYATIVLPRQLRDEANQQRAKDEIHEFTRRFFDRGFYLNIMAPTWEIATKWLHWEGEKGDEYRLDVFGGRYFYDYKKFNTLKEANEARFQNKIHTHRHFEPIKYEGASPPQNEHMILTMWWAFWQDLARGIKSGNVLGEDAKERFAREYAHWLDFHQQHWILVYLIESKGSSIPTECPFNLEEHDYSDLHQTMPFLEKILLDDRDQARFNENLLRAISLYNGFRSFMPLKYKSQEPLVISQFGHERPF